MDVKVDSNRIRSERENRGWSQGHLASVAGLSLRTIQRIEKTGSASFESATALASVLSIEVADLRATEPSRPRHGTIRLSLELPMRLALAAMSGVLCALYYQWGFYSGAIGYGWLDFVISGALFGLAVLCPYLTAGHALLTRALVLIAVSALSYFCAVTTALSADSWFSVSPLVAFLLASFIGVSIVFVAAKILIPLRVTAAFWFLGMAASLVGGVGMYAGFEVFGNTVLSSVVSFSAWHMLACLAIYRGRPSNDAHGGLLADFMRTRGRFSIVPGWMRLSHRFEAVKAGRASSC